MPRSRTTSSPRRPRVRCTRRSGLDRWRAGALLALVAAVLVGCATRTPASSDRGVGVDASALRAGLSWPARRTDTVLEMATRMGVPRERDDEEVSIPVRDLARLLAARDGNGAPDLASASCLLRGAYGEAVIFENLIAGPGNAFHVLVTDLDATALQASLEPHDPESVRPRPEPARFLGRLLLPPEAGNDGHDVRGVVVHLGSLGDRRFEYQVLAPLLERGWAVLEIAPQGFALWIVDEHDTVIDEAAFVEQFDRSVADYAYAVEAGLLYAADLLPGLRDAPSVVLGFSLGALAAPAVTARLGDRAAALVLVGGGANLARILFEGALFESNVRAVRRRLAAEEQAALTAHIETYLERTRFDPYAIATHVSDVPVLLLHASFDAIVPAWAGDLLYERLGRPERWSFAAGHLGLFWHVPREAKAIADWIDDAVARPSLP